MNNLRTVISVLILSVLLLAVAGCVQSGDTDISEKDGSVSPAENDSHSLREEMTSLSLKKEATVSLVNEAIGLMNESGELAFEQFRQKDSKWYHNDTYLSIWTTEGTRVAYAPNVSLEGESVIGLKDYSGNPLDELFIGTARSKEGEGWVSYQWPKPGETYPTLKHTFVRRASIGNQTYAVTSGFYPDDYVYTNSLEDMEYFTRFGNVSLANLIHPATVDRDLGVDYSIAHVIIGPGGHIGDHMMKNPELCYVLAGEGMLYIEDVPFELGEGKLVLIPANSKQSVLNTGNADLVYFAMNQPAWSQENEETME